MKSNDDKKTMELPDLSTVVVRPVGRPAMYLTAAERQKAYRERQKAKGFRVIQVSVRDVRDAQQQLRSEVIDLSEIRRSRK